MKVRDVLRQLAEGGRLSRVERFALESVLTSRAAVLDCNIVEGPPVISGPARVRAGAQHPPAASAISPRASARRLNKRASAPREDAIRGRA